MNYKEAIERFRRVMRDYPAGSRKHELASFAFAEYVAAANKAAFAEHVATTNKKSSGE